MSIVYGEFPCLIFVDFDRHYNSSTIRYTELSYVLFSTFCVIHMAVSLFLVVLADIVGVDRISSAFGVLLFVQGISVFVGPPFAGTV